MPRPTVVLVDVQTREPLEVCCDDVENEGEPHPHDDNCLFLVPRQQREESQDPYPRPSRFRPFPGPLISQYQVHGLGGLLESLSELAARLANVDKREGTVLVEISGVDRVSLRQLRRFNQFAKEYGCSVLLRFV